MSDQAVEQYLADQEAAHLQDFLDLLRMPSISTDPAHANDVAATAAWVAARLRKAGVPSVEILPTGGHPVVWGRWDVDPSKQTLLIYGHYDVQPADPLELWETGPFEPTERDGRIYARGAADMKGNLLAPVMATEAFAATQAKPPINLVFLFEGEEEIGSPNLPAFIAKEKERFACDIAVSADGGISGPDKPSLNLSTKGLGGCQIDIRTAATDLHSGMYGAAVPNAAQAIAHIVASFHDADGRIAIEGFYDPVVDIGEEDRADIAQVAQSDDELKEETGATALWGESGWTATERRWARPTLDINGIWGGFTGEGGKTVTPAEAHVKVTCRLVPNQTPQQAVEMVRAHAEKHAPTGVQVSVRPLPGSAMPYAIDRNHPVVGVAASVLEERYGTKPIFVRTGGTVPVLATIREELGAETVTIGFGLPGAQVHAPNEWHRIEDFQMGRRCYADFFANLAK